MANAVGSFLIRVEGAIQECDFLAENEKEKFLEELGRTFPKRLQQTLLTWRANQRERNRTSPKPADPPNPVSYADRAQLAHKGLSAKQQRDRGLDKA